MQSPRQFKCNLAGCGAFTAFDMYDMSKPGKNLVDCQNCKRRWLATIVPSCCKVDIMFVLEVESGFKTRTSLQSFPKG